MKNNKIDDLKDVFESYIEDSKNNKVFESKSNKFVYMTGFIRGVIWALKQSSSSTDEQKNILKKAILDGALQNKSNKEEKKLEW
jgi:hypothetical protein